MDFNKLLPYNRHTIKSFVSFKRTPINVFMFSVTLALLGFFLYGLIMYIEHGHHAYGVTRQHPWGLLIAMYTFFVGAATGLCIISSMGHVFNIDPFKIIGKRSIIGAIVTMLTGFLVIALEIGHPFRMIHYNIVTPGLTSAIWWMGTLYALYLTFMFVEFFFLNNKNHHYAKIFGLAGLVVGVGAQSNLGAVFGFLVARPVSNGIYFPLYFILTSMITGSYLLLLMYGWRYKMKFPKEVDSYMVILSQVLGLLLAVLMFFEIWRDLTIYYGMVPEQGEIVLHRLTSSSFLVGELLFGMLIPFVIIVWSKGRAMKSLVFAAIPGIIGSFIMRYDLVHDIQLAPMMPLKIKEYSLAPGLVEYTPTSVEWMIAVGAFGVAFVFYFIAEKLFNLDHARDD